MSREKAPGGLPETLFLPYGEIRHAFTGRNTRITGSVSSELQENGEIMSDNQHGAGATAPAPHEPQIHHVQLVGDKRKNGVGVAALVVGIVAAALATIPLIGMVAFFLGPVAIILGVSSSRTARGEWQSQV